MSWPDAASPGHPSSDVDQLMLNARLRDDLEPYWDEAIHLVDTHRMSTDQENQYLASRSDCSTDSVYRREDGGRIEISHALVQARCLSEGGSNKPVSCS